MSEPKHGTEDGMTTRYGWGTDSVGAFLSFDGKYGRDGVMRATRAACAGCGEEKKCLRVDQSEGEYDPGLICLDCIERLFSETHAKRVEP